MEFLHHQKTEIQSTKLHILQRLWLHDTAVIFYRHAWPEVLSNLNDTLPPLQDEVRLFADCL